MKDKCDSKGMKGKQMAMAGRPPKPKPKPKGGKKA